MILIVLASQKHEPGHLGTGRREWREWHRPPRPSQLGQRADGAKSQPLVSNSRVAFVSFACLMISFAVVSSIFVYLCCPYVLFFVFREVASAFCSPGFRDPVEQLSVILRRGVAISGTQSYRPPRFGPQR